MNQLFEHFRPFLRLMARLHVGQHLQAKLDASDLVQEANLLATRDIENFHGRSEQELAAWLRAILANAAANARRHYKRKKRDVHMEQQFLMELDRSTATFRDFAGNASSPSEQSHRRERAVLVANALDRLPDEYREVILMREFEGMTLAQIGERMDCSAGSVQKMWARAISRLRSELKAVK